jgi:hypothetical protein
MTIKKEKYTSGRESKLTNRESKVEKKPVAKVKP